jgi:propionyl-CoA carboxylase beta chain
MCNEPVGADLLLSWPTAEVGTMDPEGAVNIIYRRELNNAANPDDLRRRRVEEYRASIGNFPYHAAAMRWVEDIIDPRDTRRLLIQALNAYSCKREERPWKKHGNIPL